MAGIFGQFLDKIRFNDNAQEDRVQSNQIAVETNDGSIIIDDAYARYAVNLEWSYQSQSQLIDTYRETSTFNLVDFAIDDIINEMVSFSEDQAPVELDLSKIDDEVLSKNIKDKIYTSWEKISYLMDLKQSIHRRARSGS